MAFEHLHVHSPSVGVAVLTFDHGKANEMGSAQLEELESLVDWLVEHDVVCLITRSTKRSSKGTPIFVAGANVTERVGWSDAQVKDHVRYQRATLAALRRAPVFHIVVVEGACLGWGTEYLLVGDYRVATPSATFALPETGLGILPGAGGTGELWAQVGAPQALRLGMTGERIDATEAHRIGLVQELAVGSDEAMARAFALAALVAKKSPTALAAFKKAVLAAVGAPQADRTECEARAYERCVDAGEAAIGRSYFDTIRTGNVPPWGPRQLEEP
jgi:enoyl-CoA hydratase/carnithine racemase